MLRAPVCCEEIRSAICSATPSQWPLMPLLMTLAFTCPPVQVASSFVNVLLLGIPALVVAAFAHLHRRSHTRVAMAAGYGTLPLPADPFGAGYTVGAQHGAYSTRLYSSASANVGTTQRSCPVPLPSWDPRPSHCSVWPTPYGMSGFHLRGGGGGQ